MPVSPRTASGVTPSKKPTRRSICLIHIIAGKDVGRPRTCSSITTLRRRRVREEVRYLNRFQETNRAIQETLLFSTF